MQYRLLRLKPTHLLPPSQTNSIARFLPPTSYFLLLTSYFSLPAIGYQLPATYSLPTPELLATFPLNTTE